MAIPIRGLGLRPPHYSDILQSGAKVPVDLFEAISENFMDTGGRPLAILEQVRANYPIALHGVSLNIGMPDPLNLDYLQKLKKLIQRIDPLIVSDHLCWTGRTDRNWHDLIPLPMTEETIRHLVPRIKQVQEFLGRQIALENISTYVLFKQNEMTEWEFVRELSEQADCLLLLDINNIYVNSINHRFDGRSFVSAIPAKRVVQYHLAGHTNMGDFLFDTHDAEIIDPVWKLFRFAWKRIGARPFLIERDDHIPPFSDLLKEVDKAEQLILRNADENEEKKFVFG